MIVCPQQMQFLDKLHLHKRLILEQDLFADRQTISEAAAQLLAFLYKTLWHHARYHMLTAQQRPRQMKLLATN
jgi:hypothetical protein